MKDYSNWFKTKCNSIWTMGVSSVSFCEISEGIPMPTGGNVEEMRNIGHKDFFKNWYT